MPRVHKCDDHGSRLLRYLKKNENQYREKNTDNTDIFRDCILLNFMQNLLNQMMPNSHNITSLTHRVHDIFNKV